MTNQSKIRINVEDGIAVVSGFTVAEKGETTVQSDAASRTAARSRALAVAAAAGSQVLAFPAAAQELSTECMKCGQECGNPIFYPDDGSCPNPIFYPESLVAIGGALVVGVIVGALVCYKSRNSGSDT